MNNLPVPIQCTSDSTSVCLGLSAKLVNLLYFFEKELWQNNKNLLWVGQVRCTEFITPT